MKQILTFFKLALALILFLQVGQVSAQTSCTISGVTITVTGSQSGQSAPSPTLNSSGCPSSTFTGLGFGNGNSTSGFLTYTFSAPVTSAKVYYSAVNSIVGGSGSVDDGTITISNGLTPVLSNACGVSISSNRIIGNNTNGQLADANVTVTSSTPFTWIKIVNTVNSTGYLQGNLCDFTVVPLCNAGTAPTLSATTKATTCPSTTVDLTALLTSTTPAGASLVWYTNNAHTGTAIADATQVATAGTYYAFYYDATNSCYSPASAAIAVTITNCCANVAAAGVN